MSEYIFLDKEQMPDDKALSAALGKTYKYWLGLKDHIEKNIGETTEEWKFYSKKSGWVLKTLLKKRNLFFFKPYKDYFAITFVFGNKAVAKVEKSGVAEELKKDLLGARQYAEGRGLSIEVKNNKYLLDIKELIEIKINN